MKKSEIAQAYEKYLWDKCSRTTFYERIKKGYDFISALKPVTHEEKYKREIKTKKFEEEMKWYDNVWGEKPDRMRFYQRLYQGRSKEEAIKLNPEKHYNFKFKKKNDVYVRKKTPIVKKEEDNDYYEIRIKYRKEEYEIIKKEYERMIEELEMQGYNTEDVIEAREIFARLEKLRLEFGVFSMANTEKDF